VTGKRNSNNMRLKFLKSQKVLLYLHEEVTRAIAETNQTCEFVERGMNRKGDTKIKGFEFIKQTGTTDSISVNVFKVNKEERVRRGR